MFIDFVGPLFNVRSESTLQDHNVACPTFAGDALQVDKPLQIAFFLVVE